MSNQITHAEYESKVKQCQNSMSATRFAIIGLKERIADDRERWEEGNNYRTKWGLSNKHHMEWQVPGGKLRMEAIMDRVTCQERELKFLETHMDKMRGSILDLCDQRFLDSMTPVAVPVSESPFTRIPPDVYPHPEHAVPVLNKIPLIPAAATTKMTMSKY